MNEYIKKHNFTEPKPTIIGSSGTYATISGTYGTITGGRYNMISGSGDYTSIGHIGGGHNNTFNSDGTTTTIISPREPIGTEEFRASAVFTTDMAHTMSREEITTHLKRQIMTEVFENMVRDDMFEFWSNMDPATMGEKINCRLKVVKPQN